MYCESIPKTLPATSVVQVGFWIDSQDRKSTRLNSSHGYISYAVFCLKKKKHRTSEHDVSSRESAVRIGPIARTLEGHVGKFTPQPLPGRSGQVTHLIRITEARDALQR